MQHKASGCRKSMIPMRKKLPFFLKYDFLIERLSKYGKSELFVIDSKNTAMISLSNLPLELKYHDNQIEIFGEVSISLWDAGTILSQILEILILDLITKNIRIS